jgi:DNA-binding beta-propeller fold protein YncE
MRPTHLPIRTVRALRVLILLSALVAPAAVLGAASPQRSRPPVIPRGTLIQLPGSSGCLADRSTHRRDCALVRALKGPAPFLGSDAIAMSGDGRNVYVASSRSNAIAVLSRDAGTGKLKQRPGAAGCIAAGGSAGCATAIGLRGPNSVAVSTDGKNVYATAFGSNAVVVFRRDRSTGALTQLAPGSGCITNAALTGCTTGRALGGPDVVAVSRDGTNVYVGAFTGNAVAVFTRNTSSGALTQSGGTGGCIAAGSADGCASGRALAAPEGLAVSADGHDVYVAAALSNALDVLARTPSTGALSQATGGAGCIVNTPLAGCTTGVQLDGPNAVAVSPGDNNVYVTSAFSNSVTSFARAASTGQLTQLSGTSACVIYVLAVGCSLGRTLSDPEGLAVSPDGAGVYVAAFVSGAIDVLDRSSGSGALTQKPRSPGCMVSHATPDCTLARGLLGASSIVVSADGRYLYSAAFASDAVAVFKRLTEPLTPTTPTKPVKHVTNPPPGLG